MLKRTGGRSFDARFGYSIQENNPTDEKEGFKPLNAHFL